MVHLCHTLPASRLWRLVDLFPLWLHIAGIETGLSHDKEVKYWSAAQLRAAYSSGIITPAAVANNILQYVADSQQATPAMSYFIACNAQDVQQQATLSTTR